MEDLKMPHLYFSYENDFEEEETLLDEEETINMSSLLNIRKFKQVLVVVLFFFLFGILLQYQSTPNTIREIQGWSINTSRQTIDYILPYENTTLISPNVCKEKDQLFLLIVVCSSLQNFEARQTIRETWANSTEFNYPLFWKLHENVPNDNFLNISSSQWHEYVEHASAKFTSYQEDSSHDMKAEFSIVDSHNFNIRVMFLLGKQEGDTSYEQQVQINYESEIYGDILQENFIDSYNNLTLKSVLMLKWISSNCDSQVKYILKCDDDTFVNVPNLIHVLLGGTVPVYKSTVNLYDRVSVNAKWALNRIKTNKNNLLGFKFCNAKPILDEKSKWYNPLYMYNGKYYPDYLSGSAYVFTTETAKKLYRAALITQLFHMEDVYITGFVANKIKAIRSHNPLFMYIKNSDNCSLRGTITQHYFSPTNIELAYRFLVNSTDFCEYWHNNTSIKKLPQRKRCYRD